MYGWTLVVEYEDNELASDKNNVKRIEKAEKPVPAKALKWKKATNPQTSIHVQGWPQKTWSGCLHMSRGSTTPLKSIGYDHLTLANH